MKPRIAVLASGGGTTTEALVRATQTDEIDAQVELVIVSRKDAGIFQRMTDLNQEFGLNIETVLINSQTNPAAVGESVSKGYQTKAEEAAILQRLKAGNFDLIASLGYMKRIGPQLIKEFGWVPSYSSAFQAKMINTHPGLLPDTKGFYGQHIQQYVLDHHLPYGGQSLHLVSEEYDEGPILAEHKVPVEPDDTADSLFARVQAIEKQFLPGDIDAFIKARRAYNEENGSS
jgi:phosphoribosylglycinamide formyltransferase-1